MYFRERTKTCRASREVGVFRSTIITEITEYSYERAQGDEAETELVPGCYYHGKGGLEFCVVKVLKEERVIVKLREGHTLTLPPLFLDKEDFKHYKIPCSPNLFIVPRKFVEERIDEIQRYRKILIKIPGFKVYDDFHIIERGDLMIDLELLLISLSISLKTPIEQIGEVKGIQEGTPLEHRIITDGNRSEDHIIGEDGCLKVEVRFPYKVILLQGVQYFKITYDDSFSVNKKTGRAIGFGGEEQEIPFTIPKPYFKEDGWRNAEIPF